MASNDSNPNITEATPENPDTIEVTSANVEETNERIVSSARTDIQDDPSPESNSSDTPETPVTLPSNSFRHRVKHFLLNASGFNDGFHNEGKNVRDEYDDALFAAGILQYAIKCTKSNARDAIKLWWQCAFLLEREDILDALETTVEEDLKRAEEALGGVVDENEIIIKEIGRSIREAIDNSLEHLRNAFPWLGIGFIQEGEDILEQLEELKVKLEKKLSRASARYGVEVAYEDSEGSEVFLYSGDSDYSSGADSDSDDSDDPSEGEDSEDSDDWFGLP